MPLRKKILLVNSGHKIKSFLEMMFKLCSDFQYKFGEQIIGSFVIKGVDLSTVSSQEYKTRLR